MSFFQTLAPLLTGKNATIRLGEKGGLLAVEFHPDEVDKLRSLLLTGTPEELDDLATGFFHHISQPAPAAEGIKSSASEAPAAATTPAPTKAEQPAAPAKEEKPATGSQPSSEKPEKPAAPPATGNPADAAFKAGDIVTVGRPAKSSHRGKEGTVVSGQVVADEIEVDFGGRTKVAKVPLAALKLKASSQDAAAAARKALEDATDIAALHGAREEHKLIETDEELRKIYEEKLAGFHAAAKPAVTEVTPAGPNAADVVQSVAGSKADEQKATENAGEVAAREALEAAQTIPDLHRAREEHDFAITGSDDLTELFTQKKNELLGARQQHAASSEASPEGKANTTSEEEGTDGSAGDLETRLDEALAGNDDDDDEEDLFK